MFGHRKIRLLYKTSVSSPFLLRLWDGNRTFKVQAALEAEGMFRFVSVVFIVVFIISTVVFPVSWDWLIASCVVYALIAIGYMNNPIRNLHYQFINDCVRLNRLYPKSAKATEQELRDFAVSFLIDRASEILVREKAQHQGVFEVDREIGLLRTLCFNYFQLFSAFGLVRSKDEYGYYFDEAQRVLPRNAQIRVLELDSSEGGCGLATRSIPAA